MLGVNLSALGQQDLKRLLSVARERGQEALEAQILAEMQARTGRPGGWRAAPATMAFAEPPAAAGRPDDPARTGRSPSTVAATVLIALVVAGLAWGLSPHDGARPERAAMVPSQEPPRAAMALAEIQAAPREALASPAQPTTLARPDEPAVAPPAKPASRNPCYDEPTPADRLVCGYPAVAARDRRLKDAYAQAIVAGGDPRALEAEQASWKAQRDRISEWKDLAAAYDRRIAALQSASAANPTQP